MTSYGVPGVALGLIDGDAEHLAAFGTIDADTPVPIASITKTFVATAAMRLVEHGQLGLDQPLPCGATMAHLLSHTGGFQGDVRDGAFGVHCGSGDDALTRLEELAAHLPRHAPPGQLWAYNNVGFGLAGRAIEVAAAKPFESAIRELVLEPLGMGRSGFVPPGDWLPRMLVPAGGLTCPAGDLLRYARFHLGDGDGLLRPESMALMRAPRVGDALHNGCLASFADEVGLSWFSRATPQGRLLVHGGWTSLSHRLTLLPERRFAVLVLTDAPMGAQLHAEVTKRALRDWLGIEGLDAVPLPAPPSDPAEHAGRYRFVGEDDETVDLRLHGDRIVSADWGELAYYAPDRVVALEGLWRHERGQFLRGPDGAIAHLRIGGALGARVQ